MRLLIWFAFLLLFNVGLFAQNRFITGKVLDFETKEAIGEANCILISLKDSSIHGTTSNGKGEFVFENIKAGSYELSISYIGYIKLKEKIVFSNKSIDLQKLFLKKGLVETSDVEVVAEVLPVVQNADTTEFNADAFKKNKDADAENLLSKMPGVTIQNGKVQVMGEEVQKVLVDGRTFFGDDPSAVLRNLPAEVVEKIQVFDQLSEQSQFTGFNDGNTTKTINVVTRLGIKQGTFGKIFGGINDQEQYKISANYNIFDMDRRISVLGQFNNVNEQNFTPEDLLGVMAASERSGGRRGGSSRGGPPPGGRPGGRPGGESGSFSGGSNPSDFLVQQVSGLTKTIAGGLNYSDKIGDFLIMSGSYFYNNTKNDANSFVDRFYYQTGDIEQNYFEDNISKSNNTNHRFNVKMEFTIDSLNSIMFRPIISYQMNDGYSNATGSTLENLVILNSINNNFNSNLTALNTSFELLYRHRFLTKGRTVSFGINGGYRKNTGDNYLYSDIIYLNYPDYNDSTDQISNLNKKGYSLSSNLQYTEPLSNNSNLLISYQTGYVTDDSKQFTNSFSWQSMNYSILENQLSNVYLKKYYSNNIGVGYRYNLDKLRFTSSINLNMTKLISNETFPNIIYLEKSFQSILPFIMFRYNFTRDQNINIHYRTSNNEPSIDQLQSVLNNNNNLQLSIGNPDLEQDYKHNLNIRYSYVDLPTMQSFFVMLSGTITKDYIANNIYLASKDTTINNVFLAKGVQLTRPENLNGYFNLNSFISYGKMLDFIKSNLNLNGNFSYSKIPSMINNTKDFSKRFNYGAGIVISSNISENLDFLLSTTGTYNITKYDRNKSYSSSYYSQDTRAKFFWQLWEDFTINTDVVYLFDSGLTTNYNRDAVTWNISIGKKLFSDNSGEIKFSINDMLNQNSNIKRNYYDSYYEDTSSNVLGKYYLLSFTYNIKAFN